MRKPWSPSRDDFPLNAFALLQPSAVGDSGESGDHVPVPVVREDPVEVQESEASSDNSMVLLNLNLAHTELRKTVEALYHAIEAHEKDIAVLRRENVRLAESQERVKADAVATVEKAREKLQARDHENMQMQQKLRELERQKEHFQSELAENQLKMEERDATIASLEETVQQLQMQHKLIQDATCREAEMRSMIEMWSSKERAVAENTEHVRAATVGVQRLADQLQSQLKQVHSELLAAEKDHEDFRTYLTQHRCAEKVHPVMSGAENSSRHKDHHEMLSRIIALEGEKLEAATEIQVLRTKCNEFKKTIRLLSSQHEQFRATEDATRKLIVKYQESAVDGTQTIAELQESLVKLCDQLAQERKEHTDRLSEQLRVALESEATLRQELSTVCDTLKAANQDLDAMREGSNTVSVNPCTRCAASQQSTTLHTLQKHNVEGHDAQPGLLSPQPLRLQSATTPQPHRTPGKSAIAKGTLENADDVPERTETPTRGKRSRERVSSREVNNQQVSCRLCNEEPFGFMVRCQKCKDPFHAGCVKNNGTGAKKRLGHIFKCSNCAPHRPTKVARHDENSGTAKPANPEDAGAPRHRTGAPPLQVTPSRNAGSIARPTLPHNN